MASSNRNKNRKGAEGEAEANAEAADGDDHGYEVSAYLRYLRNKQNLTSREKRLLPMYEYAESSNMSEVVLFKDEKSLAEANTALSWMKAELLYFKDPRMWMFTIYDMICNDEHVLDKVFKGPTLQKWLEIKHKRTEAMVKSAITTERIHGVVIEGFFLKSTVSFMMEIMRRINATADKIIIAGSYNRLMQCLTNVAKDTKDKSRVAGYALCQIMVLSFFHLYDTTTSGAAIVTVLLSGILEQVLRNIDLPWNLEPFSIEEEEMVRDFFRKLCCPTASMHKTFKRGSPLYNALFDILEGRIRPCKENKFVMTSLHSLKRFVDLRCVKPVNAQVQNSAVETFRRTCLKCEKVDHSKQMLVCAKCKFVSYCSKECQVEDWKDHKADCRSFQYKENQNVKAVSVAAGLETMELIIHLDFRGSGHYIPPSLRDPPLFDIAPAKYFFDQYLKKNHVNIILTIISRDSLIIQRFQSSERISSSFFSLSRKLNEVVFAQCNCSQIRLGRFGAFSDEMMDSIQTDSAFSCIFGIRFKLEELVFTQGELGSDHDKIKQEGMPIVYEKIWRSLFEIISSTIKS